MQLRERPKLSDPAHDGRRFQTGRDGRVRCSAWLGDLFPSGHVHEGAGRERRLVREQPQNGVGHLLRPPAAIHGHEGLHAIDAIGFAAAGMDLRVDEARTHGVHADAFRGDLLRETDRQRVDCALGGGVIHIFAGRTQTRGAGRNIHDRAARSVVPRRHAPHGLARAEERADHIGGEDTMEPRGIHRVHAHLRFQDAGVVHQGRERSERVIDGRKQPFDVRLDGHVSRHGDRSRPTGFDGLDNALGGFPVLSEIDADGIAVLGGQSAVAAPMPRLPPVITITFFIKFCATNDKVS